MSAARARGFTLVELLVAVSVFAVLSMLAFGSVRHLIDLRDDLARTATRFDRVQFAAVLLEQDLRAAVPRGVRDALGEAEPALAAGLRGELLSLTRRSLALDGGPALSRVRYRIERGALYRDVWERLDRTADTHFHSRRLLRDVGALRLRFFSDGSWSEFWPLGDSAAGRDALPRGVEFTFVFKHAVQLQRVLARSAG